MKFIQWTDTDAYFNLAAEEYVLFALDPREDFLLLWQNKNAVVVGKHQNTIEEINQPYVDEHEVQVVRRLSGGGAVYHDLGNLNFSFIENVANQKINFRAYAEPIVRALEKMGIHAELSGRNDITIDRKKISGMAQMIKSGRLLCHGTLLFQSNLDVIQHVLNVSGDKIESKGVKSVRSRVTNICEHQADATMPTFKRFLEEILSEKKPISHYEFSERDRSQILFLRAEKYSTWEWNYGQSPDYDIKKVRRFEGGILSIYLRVNRGIIQSVRFFGDYFGNGDIEDIERSLQSVGIREDAVLDALKPFDISDYIHGLSGQELAKMIVS